MGVKLPSTFCTLYSIIGLIVAISDLYNIIAYSELVEAVLRRSSLDPSEAFPLDRCYQSARL